MNREDYKKHFEMLELAIDASETEVNKAFQLLKEIYTNDSLAIMAMPEEMSADQTGHIMQKIENSYRVLAEMFGNERQVVTNLVDHYVADIGEFNGKILREIRLKLEVSLDDVAIETRVQRKYLENIEDDNFGELPVAVYTRGFVMNYARFLSLDPEMVAKSYMDNFRQYHMDNAD